MNVTVVPIPTSSRGLLANAPGWNETIVPQGAKISSHYHDFQAYYYTFGISKMRTDQGDLSLPEAAMVVVPSGVVHGWIGPESQAVAAVGHFHDGHGYHFVE
ncbi:hypothetical protein [Bradyrhizobium sp. SZCCHNR3015]|uniref:hypothetical protein n=1 Tax=Bradyrhizobium sp. SZCCHNR3015 TaxID=3057395 RepID=UPI002916C0A6|nr:hypothetical protein [Bradyrhizobium sp. SZCCHNR3015]